MDMCLGVVFLATPLLAHSLGATIMQMGFLGSLSGCFYAITCPLAGRLSDRFGRKRMVLVSVLICAIVYTCMTQVKHLPFIYLLASIGSVGTSLFWPSVQAWISEGKDRSTLIRSLTRFNIGWSCGLLLGPLAGGKLYEWNGRFPFYFAVLDLFLLGAATLFWAPKGTASSVQGNPNPSVEAKAAVRSELIGRRYLSIAWIANFSAWFINGILRNIFPKLALELHISSTGLGALLSLVACFQIVGFLVIQRSDRWCYRIRPLLGYQMLALVACALIFVFSSPYIFGLAFSLLGLSMAMTYYASLFYSVYTQEKKGRNTGFHEGILGSGGVLGALFGGLVAGRFGLKAPYLLCFCFVACAMAAEWIIAAKSVPGEKGK